MIEHDTKRGSGRTTKLILEAPQNAFFICLPNMQRIFVDTVMDLGRQDLKVRSTGYLDTMHEFRGLKDFDIVCDHSVYANLSSRQWDKLSELNFRSKVIKETLKIIKASIQPLKPFVPPVYTLVIKDSRKA